jgi:hypothetical protein
MLPQFLLCEKAQEKYPKAFPSTSQEQVLDHFGLDFE